MRNQPLNFVRSAMALLAGFALLSASRVHAANYSWTTTTGYWTNSTLWTAPGTLTYPGSATSDGAFLTNQFAGTYSVILDAPLNNTITPLAISNTLGEAWLLITNTTLINASSGAFALGNGGRLQIDNGGIFTQQASATFSWLGTNGVIYLNNGGKLFSSTAAKTYGTTGGSVTGLVTSTSGPGNGGVWNYGGAALTIGATTAHDNMLRITDGAIITNMGAITINGNRNSFIVTNGSKVFGTGAIVMKYDLAGTANGNTIILGDGLWNLNGNSLVVGGSINYNTPGAVTGGSNNTFISLGATVTNANGLIVGATAGWDSWGNNNNTVIFTNGGGFYMTTVGNIFVGGERPDQQFGGGSGNTVILSNSVLWGANGQGSSIGIASSNNTMTLLANTVWNNSGLGLGIGMRGVGYTAASPGVSNALIINGAVVSNFSYVSVGFGIGSSGNRLEISNSGILSNFTHLTVGSGSGANGNSVVATNGGRLFQRLGDFSVGNGGNNNTVILSNSVLNVNSQNIAIGTGSSSNTVTLLGSTVWNNTFSTGARLTVGTGAAVSNALTINSGIISNVEKIFVGTTAGAHYNSLTITNGARLRMLLNVNENTIQVGSGILDPTSGAVGGGNNTLFLSNSVLLTGYYSSNVGWGSSNNTLTVRDSSWNENQGAFFWFANLNVGAGGAGVGNTLILDGVINSNGHVLVIGNGAGAANYGNSASILNGSKRFGVGITVGSGGSSNNTLTINGGAQVSPSSTVVSNTGATTVGAANSSFNTLSISNAKLFMGGALTIGASGTAVSNQVIINNGGFITNVAGLVVGGGSGANFNSLIGTNGLGFYMKSGALWIGNGGSSNTIALANSELNVSTTTIIGSAGGGGNTLSLSNSKLNVGSDTTIIGNGSSNNSVTLQANTVWNNTFANGSTLTIGSGAAVSNTLIVMGSTISNMQWLRVGVTAGANYNSLIVTNGSRLQMLQNGNNNTVEVGSGFLDPTSGTVGGGNNTVILSNSLLFSGYYASNIGWGSSNNTLTLIDSIWDENVTWTGNLNVGGGGAAVGNSLTLDGGSTVSNGDALVIGNGAGAVNYSNSMSVLNGSKLRGGSITVGTGGSSNNTLTINGGSQVFPNSTVVSNYGAIIIGNTGSGYNSMTVSNAKLFTSVASTIGTGSSNNTATLLAGATWNLGNTALTIGTGTATGNVLTVNGGSLTNVGTVVIGNSLGSVGNSLTISNGGTFTSGALTVGNVAGANSNSYNVGGLGLSSTVSNGGALTIGNRGGFNTMTITNATLVSRGSDAIIGSTASSNRVSVLSNGTWNAGGQDLYVGIAHSSFGPASNNSLTVNGGLLTNILTLRVGNANATHSSTYNSLIVTNGGTVVGITAGLTIGSQGGAGASGTGNSVVVTGPGSVLKVSGGTSLAENGWRGGSNNLIVADGGLAIFSGGSGFLLGASTLSGTNWVLVTGSGSVLSNVGNFIVGNAGVGNQLVVSNGARLSSTAVIVGANVQNNNAALINSRGVLEANTLTIGAGTTGNTISNRNATYQFTAAPAITSLTPGDIAITDGTISFRATGAASVATNAVNQINRMRFAGTNTFTLNNASNTAVVAGANQTYTFDAISGNPSNYAHLVMVNGSTAYGNANGANITIGLAGSMLISNTTATVSGLVTNTGSLSFVNAYATFQSRVYNSGTNTMLNSVGTFNSGVINAGQWVTDPTTNIYASFGFTNTASGGITMAAGDVFVFTNTQPGTAANFINVSTNKTANNMLEGKMLFSGGLALTQTFAVAGHDLGPGQDTPLLTATNLAFAFSSAAGYVNNFALGTLELSNFSTVRVTDAFLDIGTNDFLMAGLYLENLFLGVGSLLIIDTNVQVYFKNSNDWSLANIRLVDNQASLFGGDTYDYDNSISGLHQLTIIPEPSVALLCLAGFATMYLSRRRHTRQRSSRGA